MQRPKQSENGAQGTYNARDEEMLQEQPRLHEHLADRTWEDGSERQVSTLLVFTEDGLWKACLHDREARQSLWVSGESLKHVLDVLEAQLDGGVGSWRRDKVIPGRNGRK